MPVHAHKIVGAEPANDIEVVLRLNGLQVAAIDSLLNTGFYGKHRTACVIRLLDEMLLQKHKPEKQDDKQANRRRS